MALHQVDFDYSIREGASMEVDLDINSDPSEKREDATIQIKEVYPDIEDIQISRIEVI